MPQGKTNAMRILDKKKISYRVHTYEHSDGMIDGVHVAQKLGQVPERVFKTLVAQGHSKAYYVFVLPVAKEMDLKKAARTVGEKSIELIKVSELLPLTGYIRGGCSPIGMKKVFPTVFDSSAKDQISIMVSGGRIGCQIEIPPQVLAEQVRGRWADLVAEE